MVANLWRWFLALSVPVKLVLGLLVLVLAAALSPFLMVVAFLLFFAGVLVLLYRLVRRRPLRGWFVTVIASFVLVLVFNGVSGALYGSAPEEASVPKETTERAERPRAEPREETTAEPTEKTTGSQSETTARTPEAEPAPEPAPPEPESAVAASDADGDGIANEAAVYDATVTVTRVIDGDTIEITPAIDSITDVRLIGIDTPESKEPGCGAQPGAQVAVSYAASWESREVGLEFDEERTDRYGRLLAYVYDPLLGSMMNVEMLESGYAQVWIIPPNDAREDELRAAQELARSVGLGVWNLSPEEQAQLADHNNGIGSGDGACSPLQEQPSQYELAPDAPTPDPGVPSVPDAPSIPSGPADDGTCEGVVGPIPVAPGDPRDRDGDLMACE